VPSPAGSDQRRGAFLVRDRRIGAQLDQQFL
jgi:hypothetical protein